MMTITVVNRAEYDDYSVNVYDHEFVEAIDLIKDALIKSGLELKTNPDNPENSLMIEGKMWKNSYLTWDYAEVETMKAVKIDHDEGGVHIEFITF